MDRFWLSLAVVVSLGWGVSVASAADPVPAVAQPAAVSSPIGQSPKFDEPSAEATKYALRYCFHPGEEVRWEVVQRSSVRTSVSDQTQVADLVTTSVKVWRVKEVKPDGTATFEHRVESVDMRQKLTGRDAVHYNSQTDKTPPPGFQQVAQSIGVPLSVVTLDPRGKVLSRVRNAKVSQAAAAPGDERAITFPLPEEPIAVGQSWSVPCDAQASLPGGLIKKVKMQQTFTLDSVKTGVATIGMSTRILTPIHDPAIEAQLVQFESDGKVRFDLDAGRLLDQQSDVDKRVVGFRGEASSLHYLVRITEKLLPGASQVAKQPATETKK